MKYIIALACILILTASYAWSAEEVALQDNFEGSTLGKATGVTYAPGKDGQAVVFKAPSDSIEYPAKFFGTQAGHIEFDMMFPKPIPADRTFWTLLSDVGAGNAFQGALNVDFRPGNNRIEYAIWSGNDHKWCYSKTSDWEPGRWYHIALYYGPNGMKLEVDRKVEDSNTFPTALAKTPKKLGFDDFWVDSPPVMIDNFKTYKETADALELSSTIVSPKGYGFFETCSIDYELAGNADVSLGIVAADGKVVKSLINNKPTTTGPHTLVWDGKGVKDGKYTLRMTVQRGAVKQDFKQNLIVNTRWKWRKASPKFNNFFSTGMYYFWEDDATYINRHVDDPVKARAYYEKTIKDNADHGINLLMMVWTPKDHIKMVLDIARKYNVKVIIHLPDIANALGSEESFYGHNIIETAWNSIKDIKNHPALAGYYVVDEPSATPEMAKRITTAKKLLEAMDPKHPSFSCLLGGYEDLLKTVDYQVLVVDIYPITPGWSRDLSGFESEVKRGIRNAQHRPLWVIPQAFGKPDVWLIPTPEELSAEVWISVANGAKGVVYFIYQSTTGFQGEWLQGMVDMQLKPIGQGWDALTKINADMKKLAPTLLKLKPAKFLIPATTGKLIANTFIHENGNKYVILANKDLDNPVSAKWKGKLPVDELTGKEINADIKLLPGAGMLLRIK